MPNKLDILILYTLMYSIYLTFLAIVHTISIIIYLIMSVKKTMDDRNFGVFRD